MSRLSRVKSLKPKHAVLTPSLAGTNISRRTRSQTDVQSLTGARARFPRYDTGVAGRRHDIPCVQREQSRDPAGVISAETAQQVRRL